MTAFVNVVREVVITSLALELAPEPAPVSVITIVISSKVVHDPIDALFLLRIVVVAVVPLVDGGSSIYELLLIPQGAFATVPWGAAKIAELGSTPTTASRCINFN